MTDAARGEVARTAASFRDYFRILRLDHATKHVFIVPGIALALLLRGPAPNGSTGAVAVDVALGFASAVLLASANYAINEWLDRDFDRFHPEKAQRAAVQREMSGGVVATIWAVLLGAGLWLASSVNAAFLMAALLFGLSGLTYNVSPIRTKDRVYADVLSESLNNPIRLLLGWAMVDGTSLPPVSVVFAFWFGGAFLMNSKRLAEYRDIVASDGVEVLHRYRRSFRRYTENSLSVANLVYALLCAFFLAIFLIKYRIEYILVFPCVALLFAVYYALALAPGSVARKPEKLFRSRAVIASAAITAAVFVATTFVDIPSLEHFTDQRFIELDGVAGR